MDNVQGAAADYPHVHRRERREFFSFDIYTPVRVGDPETQAELDQAWRQKRAALVAAGQGDERPPSWRKKGKRGVRGRGGAILRFYEPHGRAVFMGAVSPNHPRSFPDRGNMARGRRSLSEMDFRASSANTSASWLTPGAILSSGLVQDIGGAKRITGAAKG